MEKEQESDTFSELKKQTSDGKMSPGFIKKKAAEAAARYAELDGDKANALRLFKMRIIHEGREDEWYRRNRECRHANPDFANGKVDSIIRKEMGYEGPEKERQYHVAFMDQLGLTRIEREQKEKNRIRLANIPVREAEKADGLFAEARDTLPNDAPVDEQLAWVENHLAMTRYNRLADKAKPIRLTADDILRPSHGPAPCKAAVGLLQYFVHAPKAFYDKVLDRKVKIAVTQNVEENADRVVDDVSDIEEMLRSVQVEAEEAP